MSYHKDLLGDDHIVRGGSAGYDDGEFTAGAFELRPIEKKKFKRISCDHVECPAAPENERTPEGSVKRLKAIPVSGPYALLKVVDVRGVSSGALTLDVIKTHSESCHAAIIGFSGTHEDFALQLKLAAIANQSDTLR